MTCATCDGGHACALPTLRSRAATLQDLPLREIPHQRANAEGPGFALIAGAHAIDQFAELRRRYGNNVVALVGKALAFRIAVLYRRKHGAEEQRKTVGILMHRPDGLGDEVSGVAADLADRRMPLEHKTVLPLHGQPDVHPSDIVEREG